jgi:hypothetical protein
MVPSCACRSLILLGAGVLLATTAAASDDKPPALDCKVSFGELTRTVTTHPDAQRSSKEDWDMVQISSPSTSEKDWWIALYVFTKQQHYAYPTITRKIIWKEPSGKVMTERTACGYGDKALFDKVMGEFAEFDRKMVEAIEGEHREKSRD